MLTRIIFTLKNTNKKNVKIQKIRVFNLKSINQSQIIQEKLTIVLYMIKIMHKNVKIDKNSKGYNNNHKKNMQIQVINQIQSHWPIRKKRNCSAFQWIILMHILQTYWLSLIKRHQFHSCQLLQTIMKIQIDFISFASCEW